jgi:hypothetical protein
VQILANALPGFRDLRAPVIAGYLWLAFGWLAVRPDLFHRPADHIGAALFDLGHRIGHIGIAIGVSVAAYLIGAVSQGVSTVVGAAWRLLLQNLWLVLPRGIDSRLAIPPPEYTSVAPSQISGIAANADFRADLQEVEPDLREDVNGYLRDSLQSRQGAADYEASRELTLPATVLVGKEPELFAEVDRLRAEGDLRFGVVPPLAALSILLATQASGWWWLAILPIMVLLDQGVRRHLDSRKLIADAIARGLVKSSAVEEFTRWVNARGWVSDIPDMVRRAEESRNSEMARATARRGPT